MHDNLTIKVREIVAGYFRIDPERLTDASRLRDDLGADWLDRLELMIAVEEQLAGLEITDAVADQIETIGDLTRAVESLHNESLHNESLYNESLHKRAGALQ
jgi:acyl carrier protein